MTHGAPWRAARRLLRSTAMVTSLVLLAGVASLPVSRAAFRGTTANPANAITARFAYESYVNTDAPIRYWRLQETSGTTVANTGSAGPSATSTSVTLAAAGIPGTTDPDRAYTLNGTTSRISETGTPQTAVPAAVSVELWLKTTDSNGGGIVGGAPAANCAAEPIFDMWLSSTGVVGLATTNFGAYTTAVSTVTVNDGAWHHLVITYASSVSRVYLDGSSTPIITINQPLNAPGSGFFQVGCVLDAGDRRSGLPGIGGTHSLAGTVDEVALYNRALGTDEILEHYTYGASA